MRIAFSGSGGTGKTSLLKAVNRELNFPVIEEGIRDWLESNGFEHFKDMTPEDGIRMQDDNLNRRLDIESSLQQFIGDRTSIDNLVYALRWIGSTSKGDMDQWMASYLSRAMAHAEYNYDLIFILPWGEFPIENDGVRSTKEWYQYMIQSLIEHHLHQLERPYKYEVQKVGFDDRVKECLSIIKSIGFIPDIAD